MENLDVTIIGAGVIGLAIASEISKDKDVVVIERHNKHGQEVSSRNSEIIHSGIYYPKDSLKTKLCIEGNKLLYNLCEGYNISCKKTGKLIVATDENEVNELEGLLEKAKENGIEDIKLICERELKKLEPNVYAKAALYSGSSGIIDVHSLMDFYESKAMDNDVYFQYNSDVIKIEKFWNKYKIKVKQPGYEYEFFSTIVVNSAGLNADKIAHMVGVNKYRLYYCKGEYFKANNCREKLNHLIYPVPNKKFIGLGIHTSFDMDGELRLGPNAFYVDEIDYDVDENHKDRFFDAARLYLPFLSIENLQSGFSGIRPKLQGPNDDYKDFVICHESEFPGFINLIGIESPGLTCSLSIAKYVKNLVDDYLK